MITRLLRNLIIIFFFLPAYFNAQTKEIKFNLINGVNGIFLGKINSITQDQTGAMWFSDQTNRCITQYDGTRMTRYQHDPKNPNSLGGFYPECIYADSSGFIWIGLWGFGLDQFNPVTKSFIHFRHDPDNPSSLSNDTISNILIDHQNNLWIGTMGGLDLFDPATGTFKHFKHNPADPGSLSYNKVRALYEDREGTLWVGTGFPWDNDQLGGLNRLDRKSGTFTRYVHDPINNSSLISNTVRAIFEDSGGTLWIGTMGDGLHSLNRATGEFTRHRFDPRHPERISRTPVSSEFDHITFITEDIEKKLWIGTYSNGLVRYDPLTKSLTHYNSQSNIGTGFKDESGWVAYASTGGWLWISTEESNLYKVDLSLNKVDLNTSVGPTVSTLLDEKSGVQWYTTPNGLVRKELSTNKQTRYLHDPRNPKSISVNWINRIYQDSEGTIWLSTPAGLNRFDEKTQSFTRFVMDVNDSTSLAWNDISTLYTDSKSNFWVLTFGGGLHLMDKTKGTFTRIQSKESDSTSLSGNILTAIIEGDTNDLWIGTWDAKGVNRMEYKTKKCKHYLKGVSISEIVKDSKGSLWVISENNIYKYDNRNDTFALYTIGDVPVSFNDVKSAVIDKEDNLWIITTIEVSRINLRNDQYMAYGKLNGFTAQDYPYGSTSILSNGEIVIGNFEGHYVFHPDKLEVPEGRQELFLGDFYINGKLIQPGPKSDLSTPLNESEEIRLSHDQSVFSLTFYAIDYSPEESQRFYYKLENYDKDWQQANPNRQIYYFNIPPGKYKFRINSFNTRYGTWMERNVTIIVNPPWWKSWWAY
ncbi:MAG TPA: two-component regulator propeller domain-containing protein, partial [Saprospiraceae bacterium]